MHFRNEKTAKVLNDVRWHIVKWKVKMFSMAEYLKSEATQKQCETGKQTQKNESFAQSSVRYCSSDSPSFSFLYIWSIVCCITKSHNICIVFGSHWLCFSWLHSLRINSILFCDDYSVLLDTQYFQFDCPRQQKTVRWQTLFYCDYATKYLQKADSIIILSKACFTINRLRIYSIDGRWPNWQCLMNQKMNDRKF